MHPIQHPWSWICLGCLAVATLVWSAEVPSEASRPKPPPLSLEGLLDEKLPSAPAQKEPAFASNQPCYVCHDNYRTDDLVRRHAREQIGCIDCHGPSDHHRNDEDNITPPDHMFPLTRIDGMCRDCHPDHLAPARAVLARWQERCPQKTNPQQVVCTDCHFNHRLNRRVVQWNKETGQLILRASKP